MLSSERSTIYADGFKLGSKTRRGDLFIYALRKSTLHNSTYYILGRSALQHRIFYLSLLKITLLSSGLFSMGILCHAQKERLLGVP